MGLNWIRERRRSSDKEVVQRKKVVNPDTGETPAGYNKMLRDCARIALAGSERCVTLRLAANRARRVRHRCGLAPAGDDLLHKKLEVDGRIVVSPPSMPHGMVSAVHRGNDRPGPRLLHLYHFCDGRRFTEFAAGSTVAISLAFALAAPPDKSGEAR